MIILDATTHKLELETSAAVSTDFFTSYTDITSTPTLTPGSNQGNVSTATTTDLVVAPAASTQRLIKLIIIKNRSTTTAQNVIIKKDVSGTEYHITPQVTLSAGETLQYVEHKGWTILDRQGREKRQATEISGYSGRSIAYYKIGTAAEAVGVQHSLHAATGNPGAWAVGTSGLAGRATDGTTAADNGCLPIVNPSTGANYLTQYIAASSVAHLHILRDILWVNNGVVVTTTTAQTINSVAFPARDLNGSSNGEGVNVGILVTTATTNAAAITNTTMSYTNSDGVAGRTATISSFPATAVAGTIVQFQLQAGDKGVRSIQSVTLGTSYGGGAISLIAFCNIGMCPNTVVNLGGKMVDLPQNPGVRLYNGVCLIPMYLASATTATTATGLINVMEK